VKFLLILLLIFFLYLILQAIYSFYYIRKANILNKTTFVGKRLVGSEEKPIFKLFIAGDSISAGVGASKIETSVAGRLAEHLSAKYRVQVENIGIVGEQIENLKSRKLPEENQNLIILIISSNDLFHFTNLKEFEVDANTVIGRYSKLTNKLVLIGPGNIAEPAVIPLILKPIYAWKGPKYSQALSRAVKNCDNCFYVNPLEPPESLPNYGNTYAGDNFHPNDEGHRYWFDMIRLGGQL
jgi:lysophospholipase L1-like esterase